MSSQSPMQQEIVSIAIKLCIWSYYIIESSY